MIFFLKDWAKNMGAHYTRQNTVYLCSLFQAAVIIPTEKLVENGTLYGHDKIKNLNMICQPTLYFYC